MARQSLVFYILLGRIGYSRTFFSTKCGYIGIAMGKPLVSDVLTVICGACVPFLLSVVREGAE